VDATVIETLALLAMLAQPPRVDFPAYVQAHPIVAQAPTVRERIDVGLLTASISACSVALGVTMACTSDGSCEEMNRGARWLIHNHRTAAILAKAGTCAATNYLGWRFLSGKWRTGFLTFSAAFNLWDAAHDVVILRDIDRAKAR
jgi:hypothetical protein